MDHDLQGQGVKEEAVPCTIHRRAEGIGMMCFILHLYCDPLGALQNGEAARYTGRDGSVIRDKIR